MGKSKIPETGIYDARQLGTGRMLLLGFQHMFAMFGATILVPILTGLDVSNTLLFAGLGTLLFHLITGGKVPAFLGSSFAFLGGYATIAPMLGEHQDIPNLEMLPYACFGVACAGLVYVILAYLFKVFGAKKVMRFFPPIVTGPIIIAIGLNLSSSAINNCTGNWWIAIAAILIIVAANIWGKGMIKIIPILLGVIGSYALAVIFDANTRATLVANVSEAKWFALPIKMEQTVFGLFASGNADAHKLLTAVITIVPLSLATMVEHIGDVSAISSTCNRNYIEDPGLHRTLMGDGLATTLAALFGAPANTTYGENTGVLALSRIYDPRVIRIAAVLAMLFSFSPKFAAVISSMPGGTIGGVSLVLYGMISAVGVRNVVENKVDFTKSRNVLVAALILVLSIGISYSKAGALQLGAISLSTAKTSRATSLSTSSSSKYTQPPKAAGPDGPAAVFYGPPLIDRQRAVCADIHARAAVLHEKAVPPVFFDFESIEMPLRGDNFLADVNSVFKQPEAEAAACIRVQRDRHRIARPQVKAGRVLRVQQDHMRVSKCKFRKMAIRVHGKLRNGIRDKRHRRHVDQRGALADGAVVRRDLLLLICGRFLGGQDQLLAAVFAKIMDGPIRVDLLHGMDDRRFFEHPVLFRLAHAPGKDEAGPLVRDNGCRGRDAQGGRDDRRGQTDSGDPPDRFPLRSFRMEPLHGLRPDPAGSNELFFSDLDRDARQIVHHVGYFKLQRNNPLFPALPSASSGPGRASS